MEWTQLILFLLRNWNTTVKPLLNTLHITDLIDLISKEFSKGAYIMEDKNLFYENKDTTRSSEIKATYEKAIEGNYKYYRAVSRKGKFYCWDEESNTHKLLSEGEEWAENPHYIEPADEIEKETAIDAEIDAAEPETAAAEPETAAEEEMHEVPTIDEVEAKTEAVKATVEKTVPLVKEAVTDYKALYEQLEAKYAEQEAIALAAVAKMNKYKDAMKKAAEIMIDAIGE